MTPRTSSELNQGWTLFATGFRLFFLGAAVLSGAAIVVWALVFLGKAPAASPSYFPPLIWHMHEMVYGYIGAVIAGFLLTAVNNWTGLITLRGWPLALLFVIWLGARCLPFLGEWVGWSVALLNLLFFIYLAVAIAIPILQTGNKRNLFVVVIVAILAITNGVLHAGLLGLSSLSGGTVALSIAYYLELLLTIIIAGRVFPMFSDNGLNGIYSPTRIQSLEIASVLSFIAFAVLSIIHQASNAVSPTALLTLSALTAVLHSVRVTCWFHWRIFTKPLIWVLHVGYYFLIAGILLIGASAYYPQTQVLGLHAMLSGGLGLITVGMMARVSLGHTGRDIHKPPKLLSMVFFLIALAALTRVLLPLINPQYYLAAIKVSTVFWGSGFVLFLILYTPVLFLKRIDGAPG